MPASWGRRAVSARGWGVGGGGGWGWVGARAAHAGRVGGGGGKHRAPGGFGRRPGGSGRGRGRMAVPLAGCNGGLILRASRPADARHRPRTTDGRRSRATLAAESRVSAPLLSVITVCRNALPALKRTAESVLSQRRPEVEDWGADGASTDGTPDYLAE